METRLFAFRHLEQWFRWIYKSMERDQYTQVTRLNVQLTRNGEEHIHQKSEE